VQGGRKPHYIFEQEKHYYVLTLQDYETRGNFLVLGKTEVDKVKQELLQRSIPNPFNTGDIFKLVKGVNSQYLDRTSENYDDYYTHRLTCICYVLESLKILISERDGRKLYFYKYTKNIIKTRPKSKQKKPRTSIAENIDRLRIENRRDKKSIQKAASQEEKKDNMPTKISPEPSKILSPPEIIRKKLEEIERNKNHGLPAKPMRYNNFIKDPDAENKRLFNDLRKIGKKVKVQYSHAQLSALISYYGFVRVKQAILHDISRIHGNYQKLKLQIPLMVNNLPRTRH
jgi:hypothetical protein